VDILSQILTDKTQDIGKIYGVPLSGLVII